MSLKIFQDKVFPRHVSDLMNLMHMVVFSGTDGEEKWETFLSLKQKEAIALSLAQYYQCHHCIEHHAAVLTRLEKNGNKSLSKNISSIVLFLRVDTRMISPLEKTDWIDAWHRFTGKMSIACNDDSIAHMIGFAVGIARNDDFLIKHCGDKVYQQSIAGEIDPAKLMGELESIVIFMKAAVSKNRVVDKIDAVLSQK